LNPYCKTCTDKKTCTSCSGWREPEAEKCIPKPVAESTSYARLIAELSIGFAAVLLGAITWIILKIRKINSNKVRAYSGVDASPRSKPRVSLSKAIRGLLQS